MDVAQYRTWQQQLIQILNANATQMRKGQSPYLAKFAERSVMS